MTSAPSPLPDRLAGTARCRHCRATIYLVDHEVAGPTWLHIRPGQVATFDHVAEPEPKHEGAPPPK